MYIALTRFELFGMSPYLWSEGVVGVGLVMNPKSLFLACLVLQCMIKGGAFRMFLCFHVCGQLWLPKSLGGDPRLEGNTAAEAACRLQLGVLGRSYPIKVTVRSARIPPCASSDVLPASSRESANLFLYCQCVLYYPDPFYFR